MPGTQVFMNLLAFFFSESHPKGNSLFNAASLSVSILVPRTECSAYRLDGAVYKGVNGNQHSSFRRFLI